MLLRQGQSSYPFCVRCVVTMRCQWERCIRESEKEIRGTFVWDGRWGSMKFYRNVSTLP
jgi:hypothetical protein